MNAKEFRKMYLGLQYNQVNTLTPFAIDEMLEAYLKSKVEAISDECKWENDEEYEYYETECSGAYTFIDGGVKENKYKYCPNCGRKIKEV